LISFALLTFSYYFKVPNQRLGSFPESCKSQSLIICSYDCSHVQRAETEFQPDSARNRSHNPHETYQLPSVQQITPDDGHRRCPKHVDFYDKINFRYLMHLVGCFIRILLISFALLTFSYYFKVPSQRLGSFPEPCKSQSLIICNHVQRAENSLSRGVSAQNISHVVTYALLPHFQPQINWLKHPGQS